MGLVEMVRGQIAPTCIRDGRLRREGCTVSLKDTPQPHLIIDCDKPGGPIDRQQERCDYLFIAEKSDQPDWFVPLEIKSKNMDASKVVEQLRAGARASETLIPSGMQITFRPVAVSHGIDKAQRNILKANRSHIRFHEHNEPVRLIKCGAPLIRVFAS